MAHRGLRKPSGRRSLRPRNYSEARDSQRTTSDGWLRSPRASDSGPAPRPDEAPQSGYEPTDTAAEGAPAEEAPRVSGFAPRGEREEAEPAHASHADHDDPLADAFFRHPEKSTHETWDEPLVVHRMTRGAKRAMQASIAIFLVSTLGIATYSIYHNWIMPAPVELGSGLDDTPAVLPTPGAPPPMAAPEPAPETQLAAATDPAPVEPAKVAPAVPPDTLAAIAARTPAPEAQVKVEGAIGTHLTTSAAETARAVAQPRTPVAQTSAQAPVPAQRAAAPEPAAVAQPTAAPAQEPAQEELPAEEAVAFRASGPSAAGPTYDELVAVGRDLSKRNRRVEASEAFRRALLKSPSGSAALSGLSYVYLNADENQNARLYAQRAVQADDTNAEGWIVLGAALELLGDKSGAQDAYRNCVARGQGPYLLECRRVAR